MKSSAELHRPWVTPPVSAPEFDAWLTRSARADFDANLATRLTDGAIVGYFNISQIIRGPLQSAFLGYGGVAEWSGGGYMTAALRPGRRARLHRPRPAPARSQHPARQRRLDRAGRALRLRPRGLLRALPEDRRPLARPRPLRDPLRAMGRAMAELTRCAWAGDGSELMQAYHDEEWGVPERDPRALWEKLMLDGFQAGLAWITVLRKRDAFRKGFKGFDPDEGRQVRREGHRAAARRRRDHPLAGEDRVDDRQAPSIYLRDARRRRGLRRLLLVLHRRRGRCDGDGLEFPAKTPLSEADLQGAEAARLQVRRPDDRLRLDAGGRHRQRPLLSTASGAIRFERAEEGTRRNQSSDRSWKRRTFDTIS